MHLIRSDADRILYYCENPKIIERVNGHKFHDAELAELARVAKGFSSYYTPRKTTQLTSGTTFTPTFGGVYRIRGLGAGGGGGGGASAVSAGGVTSSGGAGGGAGNTVEELFTLVGGTGYTYAIGAGGTGGTGAASSGTIGGNGGSGGDSTFAGPSSQTLHAPGAGQGQGGTIESVLFSATISGQVVTLGTLNAVSIQAGESVVNTGCAGGAWANINGLLMTVMQTVSSTTIICLANSGTIPSGTYTALSGRTFPLVVDQGGPGTGGYVVNGVIWGPGYGGPCVYSGGTWIPVGGSGCIGLASGGGGPGGSSNSTVGGTGGQPGTVAGAGTGGTSGGSGTTAGTAGTAGAANSGAGGAGGGGSCATTGGNGGAGGSGLIVVEGPL